MKNKGNTISQAVSVFLFTFLSTPVLAGTPPGGNIPEPGILSLFALGGVAMSAVIIRKRRNKKK